MKCALSSLALAVLMTIAPGVERAVWAQSGTRQRNRPAPSRAQPLPSHSLALRGYCPVCLVTMRKWVPGRPEIATLYDDHVYRFPNEELKRTFDADPAKFTPALHGDSIVSLVKVGKRVPGNINFSLIHDGRIFLFASEKERQTFREAPEKFADADLAYGGKCAVCRVDSHEDVPGKPEYTVHYKGLRYLFPGPEQRATFLASPEKYAVPRGDGAPASP